MARMKLYTKRFEASAFDCMVNHRVKSMGKYINLQH